MTSFMLIRMPSLADSDNVPVILGSMFEVRIAHATEGRLDDNDTARNSVRVGRDVVHADPDAILGCF